MTFSWNKIVIINFWNLNMTMHVCLSFLNLKPSLFLKSSFSFSISSFLCYEIFVQLLSTFNSSNHFAIFFTKIWFKLSSGPFFLRISSIWLYLGKSKQFGLKVAYFYFLFLLQNDLSLNCFISNDIYLCLLRKRLIFYQWYFHDWHE